MVDLGTRDRVLRRISGDLKVLAERPETKRFAREAARKTMGEFLRTWAFNQKDYPSVPIDAELRILFPGE